MRNTRSLKPDKIKKEEVEEEMTEEEMAEEEISEEEMVGGKEKETRTTGNSDESGRVSPIFCPRWGSAE